MTEQYPEPPAIGQLQMDTCSSPDEHYALFSTTVGEMRLHVEFFEVTVDEIGRVEDILAFAGGDRVWSILELNDCYDPRPLEWAGRHWLVMTDHSER